MSFFDDKAYTINDLILAVIAIEDELGSLPAGVYASVRTRLDILEARINNPYAPAPNVNNPFYIGGSPVSGVSIQAGFGNPQTEMIPAIPGSLFLREDGYNIQGLYAFRPDGYWHQIDTDPFTASCDLSGTIYCQTVVGIQGRPVSPAAPQTDSEGDGYVLTWDSVDGYWSPQIGFYAAGDLSGNKLKQTLVNIQGNPIVALTPVDGEVLTWNAVAHHWEPQQPAVVFGPLDTPSATNIMANRLTTQSPIDNTKLGIVNLGSRSTGATTGVTANYSAILGGDQNQVSGTYSVIAGGENNTVSSTQSFVGGGFTNTASGSNSVVVGGISNTAGAAESFIGSGSGNIINGTGSYLSILNGQSNTIGGGFNPSFINILGGQNNLVDQSGSYSAILGGLSNTIHSTVNGYNLIGQGTGNIISAGVTETVILSGTGNTVTAGIGALVQGDLNASASSYTLIQGVNNTATTLAKFANIVGDFNTIGDGVHNTHYSSAWGCANSLFDGYIAMFGLHNTMNFGSIFADIHGDQNTDSSPYTSIWGSHNTIGTGDGYVAIFGNANTVNNGAIYSSVWGTNNIVQANSTNSYVVGTSNHVNGPYTSAWGQGNTVAQSFYGYSSAWGQSNTVLGDWVNAWGVSNNINVPYVNANSGYANAFGYYHNVVAGAVTNPNGAFVHGEFGQAINHGQYTHAAFTFDGINPGTAQFSRLLLNGQSSSGGAIALNLDGTTGHNIVTENAKCYDMEVRLLVTDLTAPGTCARYVFGVLAHNEGSLVFDRVDAILLNDNGTNWVGNNWTTIFSASGNQLVITVPAAGSDTRRAVATVEWRELLRN